MVKEYPHTRLRVQTKQEVEGKILPTKQSMHL